MSSGQQALDALSRDIASIAAKSKPDLNYLGEKTSLAKQRIQETREKVVSEQARVAEVHRLQAELKGKAAQLRALAALALKQLGDRCPVCEQEYDIDDTRRRLESILAGDEGHSATSAVPDALPQLLTALSSQEKELAAAELEFRIAEEAVKANEAADLAIDNRIAELGLRMLSRITVELDVDLGPQLVG